MSLFLTLNYFTPYFIVSIVNFEHVIASSVYLIPAGVDIFMAEKKVDQVIHTNKENDRIVVIKILISRYYCFNYLNWNNCSTVWFRQKLEWLFYDNMFSVAGKFEERDVTVIEGDFKGHARGCAGFSAWSGS